MPAQKPKTVSTRSKATTKTSVEKTVAKPAKSGVSIDVYDTKGKVVETLELPKNIFDSKVNPKLVAQAVRVYLANQRAGSASTKSRGQVHGSSRKIYRQKGTGRARHGSIRAPIFVHGGVAQGPKRHDFSLVMPQKARRAALTAALSSKLKEGEIKVIDGLLKLTPKTKFMVLALSQFDTSKKKRNMLLVLGDGDTKNVAQAARNIEGLRFLPANLLNTYEVLDHNVLVFQKEAISLLEKTFGRESK